MTVRIIVLSTALLALALVAQPIIAQDPQPEPQPPAPTLSPRVQALLDTLNVSRGEMPPTVIDNGALLGAFIENSGDLAAHGMPGVSGVRIVMMNAHTPMEVAGAKTGDIFLMFDGLEWKTGEGDPNAALRERLRELKGGAAVKARLLHPATDSEPAKTFEVEVKLATRAMAELPVPAPEGFSDAGGELEKWMRTADEDARGVTQMRRVLHAMEKITHSDEGMAFIPEAPVPFRLPCVTYALRYPLQAPALARMLADELRACAVHNVWGMADLALTPGRPLARLGATIDDAAEEALALELANANADDLQQLIGLFERKTADVRKLLEPLGEDAAAFLFENLPRLYVGLGSHTDDDTELTSITADERVRLLHMLWKLDVPKLLGIIGGALTHFRGDYLLRLQSDCANLPEVEIPEAMRETFTGTFHYFAQTGAGLVVVGGKGPNTYDGEAAIIIDLGGNDTYHCHAGASTLEHPFAACIDFGGNDSYEVKDHNPAQGCGRLGLGVLLDIGQGKDGYRAKVASQGVGMLGIGVLHDEGGDDWYESHSGSQGAAVFGLGLLSDNAGTDRYHAKIFSQAFAGCMGYGALIDGKGNDVYEAGGGERDGRDPTVSHDSLSQGFAFGLRPYGDNPVGMSGGLAILADTDGHDIYLGDYFCQGGAYYYGMGICADEAGNDAWRCGRYSQGGGTHYAAGVLIDEAGDDTYDAYLGVSQGCGHDWSLGALIDNAGNDVYRAGWLSQGAGNANGIGLLFDRAGDDRYTGENDVQAWGTWDAGRDNGSYGLLIDLGGTDVYNQQLRADGRSMFFDDGKRHKWGFFHDSGPVSDDDDGKDD
ncbi:MAG: hypothetical protein AB7K09_19540 [Planctomycetota bacterium]